MALVFRRLRARLSRWLLGPLTYREFADEVERITPGAHVECVPRGPDDPLDGELVIYTGHVIDADGYVVKPFDAPAIRDTRDL